MEPQRKKCMCRFLITIILLMVGIAVIWFQGQAEQPQEHQFVHIEPPNIPPVRQHNLICNFRVPSFVHETVAVTDTECLENQKCYTGRAYHGKAHILSALGCVDEKFCNSFSIIKFRGVDFNFSRVCCGTYKCNSFLMPDTHLRG